MDFSPEDSSALFRHRVRAQQVTADFACRLSQYSTALVWRTPSRLDPQAHSDLPTNCRNERGELNSKESTHFTSFQMVTILPSPRACKQERGKVPDFILNPPSYSYYPCSPALGRATFPYMVKKKWRISAIHSHICAQPSLASMSL